MNDLLLKNCKLIDKSGLYYIGINNTKIAEISKQPLKSDDEIDVMGKIVLPGLIDPHVHFRDPGLTYKEDFKTGSLAAAHGGFTCVLDMPNTVPSTNTAKNFKEKKKIVAKKSVIDFGLHAGVNNLKELEKIAKLNPASFKIFMDLYDPIEIEEIFKNISLINNNNNNNSNNELKKPIPLTLHCENKETIEENTIRYKELIHNNEDMTSHYSDARPSMAESTAVFYAQLLAFKHKVPIHICHISTKHALKILNPVANSFIDFTTEITPHHLFFDNTAYKKFGTLVKTNPPLRPKGKNITTDDLSNIDMIGTDHAPHSLDEKQKGLWDSSPGIPNLETALPLLLTQVNRGNMDIKLIPKLMSQNPAKRFNIANKGKIGIGYDADFCIIDLKKEGKFNIDTFYSKAEYSPFENWKYQGIATMTISHGNVIIIDDEYQN
ncbi:MAG: dihydroorotase [Methanobrevibacter sp.]|nr:dihydroorotase [Methanobrevibacter sp.]